jgi:O-antigen/teichoic acid export membrane protein
MQRRGVYLRGLIASYSALAANIAYSLISIPLALHYLGKEAFGLWAVVVQITTFLQLLDFGMSSGAGRLLVDDKDHRISGRYASTLLSLGIIRCGVGLLIVTASWLAGPFAAMLFAIPEHLAAIFRMVLGLQGTIVGLAMATTFFLIPLFAHNRQDLLGWGNTCLFVVYLGGLFVGFQWGWGLYALVFSSFCGLLWGLCFHATSSLRLGFLPSLAELKLPPIDSFLRMFKISRDLFLMSLGWQLLLGSPVLILSRILGLESAATWTICTKPFYILMQFLGRPMDVSMPALFEMFARSEFPRLKMRIGQLLQTTAAMTAVGAVTAALIAGPFVAVWTSGQVLWPEINFLFVGAMFGTWCVFRIPSAYVGISKDFGVMPYIYFAETLVFFLLCWLLLPSRGVLVIPASAILCHLCFSSLVGILYIRKGLSFGFAALLRSLARPSLAALILVPCGLLVVQSTMNLAPWPCLVARSTVLLPMALLLFVFVGLDRNLREEFFQTIRSFYKTSA